MEKIIWNLKVQTQMNNPGNFQLTIIQIFREVNDSQRLTPKFKVRMRNFLQANDIMPVDKFMKIFGEEPNEEQSGSFIASNSGELTPANSISQINQMGTFQKSEYFRSPYSKQTPTNSQNISSNGSGLSMIQGNKKIFKNTKILNLGRTLFMSHPIRHRIPKQIKTKQVIQYVDQKQIV